MDARVRPGEPLAGSLVPAARGGSHADRPGIRLTPTPLGRVLRARQEAPHAQSPLPRPRGCDGGLRGDWRERGDMG